MTLIKIELLIWREVLPHQWLHLEKLTWNYGTFPEILAVKSAGQQFKKMLMV
jgi:hypothetical protein